MNYRDLIKAGLNEIEAKIYLAALELGETTVERIAKQAKLKRTTIYLHIDQLKKRGLICVAKKGKRTTYFAENPKKLEELIEERKNNLHRIMPELLAFAKIFDKKPEVRFYEGIEGIHEVLRDILRQADRELLTWYSDDCFSLFEDDFFGDYFVPERKKKRIFAKAIMQDKPILREWANNDNFHLRRSKFMPKNYSNMKASFSMYGNNKINIVSYEEKFAIIIESHIIHDSLKSIFEMMWDSLPD